MIVVFIILRIRTCLFPPPSLFAYPLFFCPTLGYDFARSIFFASADALLGTFPRFFRSFSPFRSRVVNSEITKLALDFPFRAFGAKWEDRAARRPTQFVRGEKNGGSFVRGKPHPNFFSSATFEFAASRSTRLYAECGVGLGVRLDPRGVVK